MELLRVINRYTAVILCLNRVSFICLYCLCVTKCLTIFWSIHRTSGEKILLALAATVVPAVFRIGHSQHRSKVSQFYAQLLLSLYHNAIGGGTGAGVGFSRFRFWSFFRSFFWFLHLQVLKYHAFRFSISVAVSVFPFFSIKLSVFGQEKSVYFRIWLVAWLPIQPLVKLNLSCHYQAV